MANRSPARRASPALLMGLIAIAVVGSALAQHHLAQRPKTLRLYVFDCGVIRGLDPALFNFKREEVKSTDFAVPCYLIVHPKGTLVWDVGVIPDSAFQEDG